MEIHEVRVVDRVAIAVQVCGQAYDRESERATVWYLLYSRSCTECSYIELDSVPYLGRSDPLWHVSLAQY